MPDAADIDEKAAILRAAEDSAFQARHGVDWHDVSRYDDALTLWRSAGVDRRSMDVIDGNQLIGREAHPDWWRVYDRIGSLLGSGLLVALVGRFGTGKTLMAALLIRVACDRRARCHFTTAAAMFRDLIVAMKGDHEAETIARYSRYDFLVIDEAHERANSDYEDRRLSEIINARYGSKRDTLLITNLAPRAFAESIGGAVIDRMRQCGGVVNCEWDSLRSHA